MSFGFHVGFGQSPHCHGRHHHHHGFGFRPFWRRPAIHFTAPVIPTHVTPLSETGRKFVNAGAASVAIGVIMSVVGACLAPASLGATGVLCGIGAALIIGGLTSSIYGHLHG